MKRYCKGCLKDVTESMFCECGENYLSISSTFSEEEANAMDGPDCDKCGDTGAMEGDLSSPQGIECDCITTKKNKMLIESTKKITTGHYLITDPKSEFHGQTLKVQSGVYNHLGEQIGVLLEINEDLHTVSFLWARLLRVEPLTADQKQAYYYEREVQEMNPYFEHL